MANSITIRTNASQATAVVIKDMGAYIPGGGASVLFEDYEELETARKSNDLVAWATDDAYGVGSSTLIISGGAGDIEQADVAAFLRSVPLPDTGPFSVPMRDETGSETLEHGNLVGLGDDDHAQYTRADGTRPFSAPIAGVAPTSPAHLATRSWVEGLVGSNLVPQTLSSDLTIGAGLRLVTEDLEIQDSVCLTLEDGGGLVLV